MLLFLVVYMVKLKKKKNYTFYIYTEEYIYYTNFEKKNNKYFITIPRFFNYE